MRPIYRFSLLPLCVLCAVAALGQTKTQPFTLTIDNIMRAEELIGYAPRTVRWSLDSRQVYFEWKKADEPRNKEYSHYQVHADGTGLIRLSEDGSLPFTGDISPDKHYTVYVENGDIFVYDAEQRRKRQITETTDIESNPHFTTDGKAITFERQGNLYLLSLDGGLLRQLTDIRSDAGSSAAPAGGPVRGGFGRNGSQGRSGGANLGAADAAGRSDDAGRSGSGETSQDVLKKTEKELFETVRDRIQQRDEQDAKRKKEAQGRRKPYNVPSGQNAFGLLASPDLAYVSVTLREAGQGKSTVIPNFVTESGYTEEIPGRTKVGDTQGRSRIVLLNVATGEAKPVIFTAPPYTAVGLKEGARPVSFGNFQWSEDGKHAIVTARTTDNKDLWLLGVDPVTAKTTELAHDHDDAWIGGPGPFTTGFLPDNLRVYFVSERDGYAHLYTVPIDGGAPTQLTQGKFEVTQVRLAPDKSRFYFVSSEPGPAERALYSMSLDGGPRTRITRLSAADEDLYTISPDGSKLAVIRSTSNRPPELFLLPNRPGADSPTDAIQVTHSPTEEWLSYPWLAPPIVSIPTRDGMTLYARIYKPAKWKRNGPAVLFVHGAGYLQNVHNWWSHYDREYMFHHLLMAHGYLVLDADFRGSAGYGRDWRTGIYRHMGGKDLDDEVDAAHWLIATYGVNPKHIGIYGGSYGGFLTLMAMFTAPDVFAAGAALRPVSDWANYNQGYTANILNEPQNDDEAYRRSSPIFFAEGLKGALLICHGMVDDNVHFQDSVRLVQRLIELRKENWELAAFPVESHGFTQPTSWADEYKRILKLFDANLR
jgi:dipeptidyl aminopeptidase/acylaminoacyl peptidase